MIYLNARSAMSWNQMALTIFERRKNGRTHRVLKATDNTGSVFFHTASALKYIINIHDIDKLVHDNSVRCA